MNSALFLLVGLILGTAIAWFLLTRLEKARSSMAESFKALSSDVLRESTEQFLRRAGETLQPLKEKLTSYESLLREIERNRNEAYGALKMQVQSLGQETRSLSLALRNPQVRGRWGEIQLRRVVELAGMSEHCDFAEQISLKGEDGRLRPDMIVNLPAGRKIVVDSKVPLDAYLKAIEADSEETRQARLKQHADQLRDHMNKLAQKSYWEQFDQTPEFVVMFIPGESFFSAAAEQDPTLIEDGMKNRVVLATPTTLIALLRAVAYGWRQEQLARSAQEISELGKEFYDRLRTFAKHIAELRDALEKVNAAYNKAVGSLESRVFPSARRFRELGVQAQEEIPTLEPIDTTPRRLTTPKKGQGQES